MQFNVEIVKVTPPQNMGKYSKLDVVYKKDGKVEGKPFMDFKHPDVYKILSQSKEGDNYLVTSEKEPGKDGKEYWNWTGIESNSETDGTDGAVGVVSGSAGGQTLADLILQTNQQLNAQRELIESRARIMQQERNEQQLSD